MRQYIATNGGNITRLLPEDITKVRETEDGSLVSLSRGDSPLLFEAVGGPYGLTDYFFPCDVATAEKIVAAVQEGRNYWETIGPEQMELAIQASHFHAIASGVG